MKKNYYSYAESGRLIINKNGTTDYLENDEQSESHSFIIDAPAMCCKDYENKEKNIYNSDDNLILS